MRKIISLFKRDYDGTRLVYDEVVEGAEWVVAGEGIATRKYDGTSCMVRDGRLYKRYDAKPGRTTPPNWEPAQDPDANTGHWPGWLPVGDGKEDRWHREGWNLTEDTPDGTYELIGPKVQGNAEHYAEHRLIPHGADVLPNAPRDFDSIRTYLSEHDIEGIVWHHPDGRMVKIKSKDFGIKRR
jgi:hypothetical protein